MQQDFLAIKVNTNKIQICLCTLVVCYLMPFLVFAQKEQSIWMLGQNTGLDFSNTPMFTPSGVQSNLPPGNLRESKMDANGGGATMADADGNLLFYTDGVQVWSKNHQVMANGTGLKGNPETTQTVLILPKPLHMHRYYIVTTDARTGNSPNALRYSEVDMALQNGMGEVIQKNILLLEDVSEKITATLQANNQDFWLLSHTWNTNEFYAYNIDSSGINASAVKTRIGSVYAGQVTTGRGSFKLSALTNRVVVALPDIGIFDVLAFENKTGLFTTHYNLSDLSYAAAYAEFSYHTRLYTVSTNGNQIFEFETNGTTENGMKSSLRTVASGTPFGDLRLARNGLVYVVAKNSGSLHTIEYNIGLDQPAMYAKPSIYKANAINIGTVNEAEGLPNTISKYAQTWWGFGYVGGYCLGDPITYIPYFPNSIDSIVWNFDDPASGALNIRNELSPTHAFQTKGKRLDIKATIYARGNLVEASLYFYGGYAFNFGADTAFCFNENINFRLQPNVNEHHNPNRVVRFNWQDGSTNPAYDVTKPGIYWLEVTTAQNCIYRDTIVVKALPIPAVYLGNDTTLCTGKTLLLDAGNEGSTYVWQDGSRQQHFTVAEPGVYHVTVTNPSGCVNSDTIRVYYLTPPAINLGADTTICQGTEILLNATLPGVTYVWQDGSTGPTFKVTKPGTYWVEGSIDICSARDYIVVKTRQGCVDGIFVPNVITPNGDGLNDTFVVLDPDASSVWLLEVYNRYGKLLYRANQYDNTWDASGLPSGTYYYFLQDNKGRRLKDYLQVIR
jgi:gliding motility-associated-like protein